MDNRKLADLACLTTAQKQILDKARMITVSNLLEKRVQDVAKKCIMRRVEVEKLIDLVCQELNEAPPTIRQLSHIEEEVFTTGERYMDEALGGGVRTGMLWEIAGDKNVGKTQLALQLSLTVQLPPDEGGLYGAAYYISTRDEPQVLERLQQIIERHPLLSPRFCALPQHYAITTYPALCDVLQDSIPKYANELRSTSIPGRKRLKLLVVDAFSELFDVKREPKYDDNNYRAQHLRQAGLLLHRLASEFRLAVVVLGGTRETSPRKDGQDKSPGELRYSDQARWFSRGYSLDGEDATEAILGHVWPNQLNARVMMSRTIRERPRHDIDPKARKDRIQYQLERACKRRRLDPEAQQGESTGAEDEKLPLRRFSVLFSSVAPAASCDYAILDGRVIAFPPEEQPPSAPEDWPATLPASSSSARSPSSEYYGSRRGPSPQPSTSSTEPGPPPPSPRYAQSLSYVTNPSSRQPTPPPSSSTGRGSADDDDDGNLWRHFPWAEEDNDVTDDALWIHFPWP